MNNRRIWFRLGGVLAAAAVCTGGAVVVSDRAQEAKNVQRAFLGAMETGSIDSQISLSAAVSADDEVCRERYPTFETARQVANSIDDQAYIKEARFA